MDNEWDDEDYLLDSTDKEEDSKEISLLETSLDFLKPKKDEKRNFSHISDVIKNLKDLSHLHKDEILNEDDFHCMKSHLLNEIKK